MGVMAAENLTLHLHIILAFHDKLRVVARSPIIYIYNFYLALIGEIKSRQLLVACCFLLE